MSEAKTIDAIASTVASAASAAAGGATGRDGGGWAMADDAISFLTALVDRLAPAQVVEFGGGRSTVALTRAVADLKHPGVVSAVDNDPVACRRTRAALADAGVSRAARVVFAPLVVRRVDDRHLPVYLLRRHRLASDATPGLVVVDGPPSMLGGREGALRQALALAGAGTVMVVDDADRPGETEVVDRVQRAFGDSLVAVPCPGFARGIAALVVSGAVTVRVSSDGLDDDPIDEARASAARRGGEGR